MKKVRIFIKKMTEIRATKIRISSNHRKLHGAIFSCHSYTTYLSVFASLRGAYVLFPQVAGTLFKRAHGIQKKLPARANTQHKFLSTAQAFLEDHAHALQAAWFELRLYGSPTLVFTYVVCVLSNAFPPAAGHEAEDNGGHGIYSLFMPS